MREMTNFLGALICAVLLLPFGAGLVLAFDAKHPAAMGLPRAELISGDRAEWERFAYVGRVDDFTDEVSHTVFTYRGDFNNGVLLMLSCGPDIDGGRNSERLAIGDGSRIPPSTVILYVRFDDREPHEFVVDRGPFSLPLALTVTDADSEVFHVIRDGLLTGSRLRYRIGALGEVQDLTLRGSTAAMRQYLASGCPAQN